MSLGLGTGVHAGGRIGAPPVVPAPYSAVILADSPIAYWRLGEASGITAEDQLGSHDGTYSPNAAGAWTGGTLAQAGAISGDTAALFNGTNGMVDCGTDAALGVGTAFSLECLIKTTNADGTGNPIVTKWLTGGSNYNFYFGRIGTSISFYLGDFGHVDISESLVNDGEWHHIVATVETLPSKVLRIYVDAYQVGNSVAWASTGGTGAKLEIGGNEDASGEHWDGSIDEVAIYDYTLTPAQVEAHYDAALTAEPHYFIPSFTNAATGALRPIRTRFRNDDFFGREAAVTFTPASVVGTGDYSIIKRGSTYFMVYSNTRIWLDNTQTFGVASSTDLITWTEIAAVSMSAASAPNYHFSGPEWFVDDDDSVHVIIQGVNAAGTSFQFLVIEPDDDTMLSWGTPGPVTWASPPSAFIDAFLVRVGSTYHLWYKNETTKHIEFASASSLLGPYTIQQTGDWAGWGDQVEGECLQQLEDGTWLMICDRYGGFGLSWSQSATSSFTSTWTPLAYFNISGMPGPRHGTPIRLNPA